MQEIFKWGEDLYDVEILQEMKHIGGRLRVLKPPTSHD